MRPRGGIIGASPAVSKTAAMGIWTLREVENYRRLGEWATVPDAPTGVVGAAGNGQVSLTWTAPASNGSAITDYLVQSSSDNGSTWTDFSDGTSTDASATVTGLTNGTTYTFRVSAVNSLGSGGWSVASDPVVAGVLPSPSLLLRFDGALNSPVVDSSPYSVSLGGNSVVTDRYGDAFVGFRDGVEGSYGAGIFLTRTVTFADLSLGTSGFTFEGWLAVWGNQGYANDMQIFGNSVFSFKQMADSSFVFSVAGSAVVTTSTIGASVNTFRHVALVRNGNTVSIYANGTRVGTGTTSASLSGSGMYIGDWIAGFMDQVRIVKAPAYAGATLVVPTSPFTFPPTAPASPSATAGVQQATLSWSAPSVTGGAAITDYVIQYSSNGGSSWATFSDSVSTATSATVTGLAGGSYIFRVAAVNSAGTGDFSPASSSVTVTSPTAPSVPTSVAGTAIDGSSASVTWTAPSSNGGAAITDYIVQFSNDSGSSWATFSDGTSTATSATVTGLSNGIWVFRVAAVNSVGTGDYSSASSPVTLGSPDKG